MRKSRIGFNDFSLVATHCASLSHYVCQRTPAIAGERHANDIATHGASRRKHTSGLRLFSKIYGMRSFLPALRALHRNGIEFHMGTPNAVL